MNAIAEPLSTYSTHNLIISLRLLGISNAANRTPLRFLWCRPCGVLLSWRTVNSVQLKLCFLYAGKSVSWPCWLSDAGRWLLRLRSSLVTKLQVKQNIGLLIQKVQQPPCSNSMKQHSESESKTDSFLVQTKQQQPCHEHFYIVKTISLFRQCNKQDPCSNSATTFSGSAAAPCFPFCMCASLLIQTTDRLPCSNSSSAQQPPCWSHVECIVDLLKLSSEVNGQFIYCGISSSSCFCTQSSFGAIWSDLQ